LVNLNYRKINRCWLQLPQVVTFEGGQLRINGIQFVSTWVAANRYYVGDWSRVNKIITEGLSLEFSEQEGTNFVKNNITARIEAQVALATTVSVSLRKLFSCIVLT
jgi:hypothetical protein